MPSSSKGTLFYDWPLPALSARDVEIGIEFNELRNDLGNGYRSQVLYGPVNGLRSWNIKLPSLADTSIIPALIYDVNSTYVSREAAIWNLYCETRITGKPFAYTCPRRGRHYLVDFTDKNLKYAKQSYVKSYSTGIELEQVRLDGETIFSLFEGDTSTATISDFSDVGHDLPAPGQWTSEGPSDVLAATGDVIFEANPQNGHNTVRFNSVASTGYVSSGAPLANSFQEVFIVLKVREATFSSAAGILTNDTTGQYLIGTSGQAKFQNVYSGGVLEYRLNGLQYDITNQVAPMNKWGVIHLRFELAQTPSAIRIGKNGNVAATYAKIDVGEVVFSKNRLSMETVREMTEHLIIKWGI